MTATGARRGLAPALLLSALAVPPAAGQDALADCVSANAERVVAGCTRLIDDRTTSPANRTLAHERRGYVLLQRRDLERSIEDFTAVLRDDPDRPLALYARGMARLFSGDAAGQNEMESALLRWPAVADVFKRYGPQ